MSELKVHYIQHCGSDLMAVNAARISFAGESEELAEKDAKLIDYLAKNKHMSPFEHNSLTVIIECPLYIRSQIHRHRTFAYNEISRRYTADNLEFYIPPTDDIRKQSKSNKQASDGLIDEEQTMLAKFLMDKTINDSLETFNKLIEIGVSREQARGFLPQCLMTKFYMTGNLRNWVHFIALRDHDHAQKEVRELAVQVRKIIEEKFPVSAAALFKYNV